MTSKEEAFALGIIKGLGPSAAYEAAGYAKCNPNVTAVAGQRIMNRPAVSARIAELRNKAAGPLILTRQRKLEKLARMIDAVGDVPGAQLSGDQLKALEIDNKMQGHNEAEKLLVTGIGSLMQKMRLQARKP